MPIPTLPQQAHSLSCLDVGATSLPIAEFDALREPGSKSFHKDKTLHHHTITHYNNRTRVTPRYSRYKDSVPFVASERAAQHHIVVS